MDPVDALLADAVGPGTAVVIVDPIDAALPAAVGARCETVEVVADALPVRRALGCAATLTPDLLAGTDLVLLRLPRSLAALEEYVEQLAAWGPARLRIVAAGRVKHMSRGMNDVLGSRFADVHAGLGSQKSRALFASSPTPGALTYPRLAQHADLDLTLVAHGLVFAGTKVDVGSRLLAGRLPTSGTGRALDLGCGSGLLATLLARAGYDVVATDASAAACASTRATAAANGVRIGVVESDAGDTLDGPFDLIACNPPFHVGAAKDSSPAFAMIEAAGRLLRPGGELVVVFNAHLPYLPTLARTLGPTRVVARNRGFVVTSSTRSAR